MAEPWDRPPFPPHGNKSQRALFAAMGQTLNAWEEVEVSMAHLYSAFTTGDRFDAKANHAYGAPDNFRGRLGLLQEAALQHYIAHPSQEIEGECSRLLRFVTGYSARRNDIAHGHVLLAQWVIRIPGHPPPSLLSTAGEEQWCLVPPHFRANKFTTRNRPAYALTSWEIGEFGRVFWDLVHAFSNLAIWTIQHAPPSPYIRPQPSALPYNVRSPRTRRVSEHPPQSSLP